MCWHGREVCSGVFLLPVFYQRFCMPALWRSRVQHDQHRSAEISPPLPGANGINLQHLKVRAESELRATQINAEETSWKGKPTGNHRWEPAGKSLRIKSRLKLDLNFTKCDQMWGTIKFLQMKHVRQKFTQSSLKYSWFGGLHLNPNSWSTFYYYLFKRDRSK